MASDGETLIKAVYQHPDGYFLPTEDYKQARDWDKWGWEAKATIGRAMFNFTDDVYEHLLDFDDEQRVSWEIDHRQDLPKDALLIADRYVEQTYYAAKLGYLCVDIGVDAKKANIEEWRKALFERLSKLEIPISEIERERRGDEEADSDILTRR